MKKTFLEHIGDFAAAGERAKKAANKGLLPDNIHKHIETLIDAARTEGRMGREKEQDATDFHHDRLIHALHKHLNR